MREERYYRVDDEYIRKLENEIELGESLLTEKERREMEEEDRGRIRQAIEKAEHIQNAARYIPNEKKLQEFQRIYKGMLEFAKSMLCDIVVESNEETSGTITLLFNCLFFEDRYTQEELRIFMDMISKSDTMICSVKNGVINLKCSFTLADKVYMQSLL